MRNKYRLLLTFYAFTICALFDAHAVAPFSKYGQIQNVQSYSSNPFWTPDAPYNQRMPTPVYSTGTDIKTSDCIQVVKNLLSALCETMDYCADATLMDVRPVLITQMSRMPGGNYATACGGYLDTVFSDYKKQKSHISVNINPSAIQPLPSNTSRETNTYDVFAPAIPEWAQEVQQRKQELQDLKEASGYTAPQLQDAKFPTTYADLSFTARIENEIPDFKSYQDKKAYRTLEIEQEAQNKETKTTINNQPIRPTPARTETPAQTETLAQTETVITFKLYQE